MEFELQFLVREFIFCDLDFIFVCSFKNDFLIVMEYGFNVIYFQEKCFRKER